ncbi:MAG: ABC transporter substrate-binding protein [Burkholderiales bacterium]
MHNARRRFLTNLGAGLMATPLASWAQQPTKVARLGYLSLAASIGNGEEAFLRGMRDLGYVEGRNFSIEWRFAKNNIALLPELAADLVRLNVEILLAVQSPSIQALKQATGSIPIVMVGVGDPVATGLITSLARPGGNITGRASVTAELAGKCLEMTRELFPASKSVAVLINPNDPFGKTYLEQVQSAGRILKLALNVFMIRAETDVEPAFREMTKARNVSVLVQGSLQRKSIHDLAVKHRIAAISSTSSFADNGGLLSYSGKLSEMYGGAAYYVDRILKGAKPADLPVAQPTLFELVINMKIAKTLGIKVPQSLLARADRLIE